MSGVWDLRGSLLLSAHHSVVSLLATLFVETLYRPHCSTHPATLLLNISISSMFFSPQRVAIWVSALSSLARR